jgi:hypothetical protein
MKRKFTLIILLLIFAISNLKAQKNLTLDFTLQPGMSFGGDYFYDYRDNLMFANSFTFNLKFGANLGYYFNEKMGISMGLLYDHLGQNYKDFSAGGSYPYTCTTQKSTSLNYLKIPMLFNYIFSPKEQFSFTFSTGFYLSFLFKYTDETKKIFDSQMQFDPNYPNYTQTYIASGSTYSSGDPTSSFNYEDTFSNGNPFSTVDFGGIISAGILYKFSAKISIPVLLSYNFGFVNIKNTSSIIGNGGRTYWDGNNFSTAYHNSSFGLQFGVRMNLQ